MGQAQSYRIDSNIEIINNTYQDITNTRCYDTLFDTNNTNIQTRPYHTLQNLRISAIGGRIERHEDFDHFSSAVPFIIVLTFMDGSTDEFRLGARLLGNPEFDHLRGSDHITCYRSGIEKITIKVENTAQQIENHRAEEKNKEGAAALKQKQFEVAMKKFDEGLKSANQTSTINVIKKNKSRACSELGKKLLQEAWDVESDDKNDRSQEAKSKFDQARSLFQAAQNLWASSEYQQNLKIVDLKIDGNRLFNEANELEKEAFKYFESGKDDNTSAKNKYKEALLKYKQAVQKFEEGAKLDNKFGESVNIANEFVQEVKKVVDDIETTELKSRINKVNIDEGKTDKNEQVTDTMLQEQIDDVAS
ncbi:hypothetical protein Zmor_001053 [Zophobas morio]|uniref:Uncharacterized protein n=1 Tax=Zophobas morio TaxID=2755281 RepID=A0AA38J691_9CUCU|nr:hypothetical protein Zmor_001053 [Zophobas morio]